MSNGLQQSVPCERLIGHIVTLYTDKHVYRGRLCQREKGKLEVRVTRTKSRQRVTFLPEHVEAFPEGDLYVR